MITQLYDRQLRPTGLRATQFTVLVVLALEGPLPLSVAAERLGTERTTLTRNLRALIARGLVTTEPARDRRVQMLAVTPKGLAAARGALPRWREAQRSISGHMTAPALQALERAALAESRARPSGSKVSTGRKKEG